MLIGDPAALDQQATKARADLGRLVDALGEVIVGQSDVIEQVVTALVAGGHVLLEGVPGLGKTLLVRTLGQVSALASGRVQFAVLANAELVDAQGRVYKRFDELTVCPNVLAGVRLDEGPRGRDVR